MNPHTAVHPPAARRRDFDEILEDFDSRCHERVLLDPSAWKLPVRVRLLNQEQQKEFEAVRADPNQPAAKKYAGAPSLYAFSEVYFNSNRTVALVYATHFCGDLCGEGFWTALAFENGVWKPLDWDASRWIS